MGAYYETFEPPFVLTRRGAEIPDYQSAFSFSSDTSAVDARLAEGVKKRFQVLSGALDYSSVEITVVRGFVTLSGAVADARVRDILERFANNTIGVRSVANKLTVQGTERQGAERR